MKKLHLVPTILALSLTPAVRADAIYFDLSTGPLLQDWSNPALISSHDDWSQVPSILGFRGDGLAAVGTSPAAVLGSGTHTPVDVLANQTNTNSASGGVAEFALTDPTIALQGSGTAAAPFLLFHLDASAVGGVHVAYTLRDLDGSDDDAAQAVALHYRLGDVGDFSLVPSAFVADATLGPDLAGFNTPVAVDLPGVVAGAANLQLRIMTVNASGSDEWVGIDDIVIRGWNDSPASVPDGGVGAGLPVVLAGLLALGRHKKMTARRS